MIHFESFIYCDLLTFDKVLHFQVQSCYICGVAFAPQSALISDELLSVYSKLFSFQYMKNVFSAYFEK